MAEDIVRGAEEDDMPAVRAVAKRFGLLRGWPSAPDFLDAERAFGKLVLAPTANGQARGFGGTLRRGAVTHLGDLFVLPEHQSSGVGRSLLAELLGGDGPKVTFASSDPRAMSLYIRYGLRPWCPLLYLTGPASGLPGPASGLIGPASGLIGPASGLIGPASGLIGPSSGLPGSASGLPGPVSGVSGSASGLSGPASGLPSSASGPPSSASGLVGLPVEEARPEDVAELDARAGGGSRTGTLAWYASIPGVTLYTTGHGYAFVRVSGGDVEIGPAGGATPRDCTEAVLGALAATALASSAERAPKVARIEETPEVARAGGASQVARGEGTPQPAPAEGAPQQARIAVPGVHPLVSLLVEAGWRIGDLDTFMADDGALSLIRPDRYVPHPDLG
ncbi:GNAT family N-acetyltransferase [Nonomuraea sp. SMC257]|uniref:GNAT family N-acetyltransferase n=1 Tax=Nonomuraea montanisoli TaxID=2741721 RepID=A0A7Y6IE88_9ACTN|nr:GNAT family N-acetyltransferase [Nonomuraea montanisoli]NUW36660.1 GNAT family N-acetyltransferase [Nonomuraea montanisoli]